MSPTEPLTAFQSMNHLNEHDVAHASKSPRCIISARLHQPTDQPVSGAGLRFVRNMCTTSNVQRQVHLVPQRWQTAKGFGASQWSAAPAGRPGMCWKVKWGLWSKLWTDLRTIRPVSYSHRKERLQFLRVKKVNLKKKAFFFLIPANPVASPWRHPGNSLARSQSKALRN